MADTAVAQAATPKVAKKKAAAKPKKPAAHPKYAEMIQAAVSSLKERGGSSRQAILKYICANYKVDDKAANSHLKLALRAGVKNGSLKQSKGTGASGSFRLGEAKKKPAKKAAKPKAAKPKKAKSPKKAKKPAAKKPAAKKTSVKKAAKPRRQRHQRRPQQRRLPSHQRRQRRQLSQKRPRLLRRRLQQRSKEIEYTYSILKKVLFRTINSFRENPFDVETSCSVCVCVWSVCVIYLCLSIHVSVCVCMYVSMYVCMYV